MKNESLELQNSQGMTIVELLGAIVVLVIGLSALSAFFLSSSRQQELDGARLQALTRVEALMEEIRGSNPGDVVSTYDGQVDTTGDEFGTELTVTVDDDDPTLLIVTVEADWQIRGEDHDLSLVLDIYNSEG